MNEISKVSLQKSPKPQISIVIPTRGLLFTQVLEAVERERVGYDTKLYLSHDLPIPDGHNVLAEKALSDGAALLWMIEEDCVVPTGALEKLLAVHADIACIDYGVSGWGCVTRNDRGEILWCGLGCTLIKRQVFEVLEKPYFRTDKVLRINDGKWIELPENYVKTKAYGSLDIWFGCQVRKAGFKIVQVEGKECEHLQLISLGERGTNNGTHLIVPRPGITKKQVLNNLKGGEF